MRGFLLVLFLLCEPAVASAQSLPAPWTSPNLDAASANITTATTTLIVSGVANESIWLWSLVFQASGNNAGATLHLVVGQGATCGTAQNTSFVTVTHSATTGQSVPLWGSQPSVNTGAPVVANAPLQVTSGAAPVNICVTTGGGTIAGKLYANYALSS